MHFFFLPVAGLFRSVDILYLHVVNVIVEETICCRNLQFFSLFFFSLPHAYLEIKARVSVRIRQNGKYKHGFCFGVSLNLWGRAWNNLEAGVDCFSCSIKKCEPDWGSLKKVLNKPLFSYGSEKNSLEISPYWNIRLNLVVHQYQFFSRFSLTYSYYFKLAGVIFTIVGINFCQMNFLRLFDTIFLFNIYKCK